MENTIKTTEIVNGIQVTIPKAAKTLAKFVGNDYLRTAMQYVCIDAANGLMCATDAHKLQALRVDVQGVPEGVKILLDPKHVTKVAGKEVSITVREEVREKVNDKGETRQYTVMVSDMVCGGETYRTETGAYNYPNFMAVLPKDGINGKERKNIRLTPESVEALKAICKIEKRINIGKLVFLAHEGSKVLTVCAGISDVSEYRAHYKLELSEVSPVTCLFGLNSAYLAVVLDGFDGVLSIEDNRFVKYECITRALLLGGFDGYTLLMPSFIDEAEAEFIRKARKEERSDTVFAEDMETVLYQLQAEARYLWKDVKKANNGLIPGNYSAMDIANPDKAKCGKCCMDCFTNNTVIHCGNVTISMDYYNLFYYLAKWEAGTKDKSVFTVGQVSEATGAAVAAPVQEQAGEIRVKCLQYAANGNDVCEKYEQLKKYADGVYYKDDREWNGYVNRCIYFEENGIFWHETDAPDYFFEKPEAREKVEGLRKGWFDSVKEGAEQGEYIRKLTIEVFRRLGLDTSALMEAREKAIRRQEEEERRKWEEQERKRLEALEAEKKRKAEALEDGRKKLLAFEPITAEQVELLAENIGMKINIRTLGFIRKNVRTATHNENCSVSVSGNVKGRSVSGVCDVIWALYKAYKAEAEQMEAAQEAAANLQYAAIETPDLNFDLGLKPEDVNAIAQGMADNTPAVEAVAAQDYVLNQFAGFTDEQLIGAAEYIATDKISTRVEAVEFLVWHAAWDIREMESEQVSDEDEAQAESEAQAEEQTRRKTAERISEQAERLHDIINAHWDMKKMCFPEVWNRRYLKVCKLHRKYIDNIYKAAGVSDNDGARKNNAVWRHFAVPASVYAK